MLHWIKIILLLALTLAAMRALSWGLGWLVLRFLREHRKPVCFGANAACFILFGLLLYNNRNPGGMDFAALLFGAVVYLIFFVSDLFWLPFAKRPS